MRFRVPVPVRAIPLHPVGGLLVVLLAATLGACGADSEELGQSPQPREAEDTTRPVLAAAGDMDVDRGSTFQSLREQDSGSVLVIFTQADGWAHVDQDGRLTGVSIEILEDFFAWVERTHGVQLEVIWTEDQDWMRFYRRVRNAEGGVIGAGNVTITAEREEELDFSPAYHSNVAVLITHESVPELPSMAAAEEHFAGFAAHPYRGTLHEERINRLRERRIPGLRVLPLRSNAEILDSVANHTDRLAWIDAHAYWRAVRDGVPIRRHPVADDDSESYGFILPQGSDWTAPFEQFFLEGDGYRNSERYREILNTHLGEGLTRLLDEARSGRAGSED